MEEGARAGAVTLHEITEANRSVVEALAVTPEQTEHVDGVRESLAEAVATPDACPWYRAVYADGSPVGFVMLSDGIPVDRTEYLGPYYLWRLLIDARCQGRGHGRAALDLVVDYVRTRPDAEQLLTSYVPGPASAVGFYLGYGFAPTGAIAHGEPVLSLPLH